METINSEIKKCFSAFMDRWILGDKSQGHSPKSERQRLLDNIYTNFDLTQKRYTTDESLLFPSCFYVFLKEEDYRFHHQAFKNTAQDVMKKIVRRVKRIREDRYPDYIPHSRHFVFTFIRMNDGDKLDEKMLRLLSDAEEQTDNGTENKDGEIRIFSELYAPADKNRHEDDSHPVAMTVHTKETVSFKELDINMATLHNLEVRGDNHFRFRFSLDGEGDSPSAGRKPVATLRVENGHFLVDGDTCRTYEMCTDELLVSGRVSAPDTQGQEVVNIDSDNVLSPHLIIRRKPQGTFEIKAKADTFINEVEIETLLDTWEALPNNSVILLNGEIQLKFKIS